MMNKLIINSLLLSIYVYGQCKIINIQSTGDMSKASACKEAGSVNINAEGLGEVNLKNLQSVSDSIKISGTSTLTKVSMGKLTSVKNIEVVNNSGLNLLDFPSLGECGGYVFISGNSDSLVLKCPKLQSIGSNSTFSNIGTIDVSNLKSVKSSLSFTQCGFKNISLSNLSEVASSFSFSSNDKVSSLSVDKLESIGGALLIANNTELKSASFSSLSNIKGAIDVNGPLNKFEVPNLNEVQGNADIQSSSKDLSCDNLNKLQAVVAGQFKCDDGATSSSSSSGSKSGSKSASGNTDSSNAVKVPLSLFSTAAVAVFSFLL